MKWLLKFVTLTLMLLCFSSCSKETITPQKAYCPMQIGVVMDINGMDDNSYNQLVWNGVKDYAESARLSTSCFKYFESTTEDDYVPYLRTFADTLDVVIAASPTMAEELVEVAEEYNKVLFLLVDAVVEGPNIVSLNYDDKFASFLAGSLSSEYVSNLEQKSIAYIGDSIQLGAIYEQGATMNNDTIHVEFEFDEEHMYSDASVYYLDNMYIDLAEEAYIIGVDIQGNSFYDCTIVKNISDDIYKILKMKASKKVVTGPYNSTNYSVVGIDYDAVRKYQAIVNSTEFIYAEQPLFMMNSEVETIQQ